MHTNSASRGIGLELTKQLLDSPSNIILAACRNPSNATALNALSSSSTGRVHVLTLDVTNHQSVRDAAKEAASILGDSGIDYLINNAGIVSFRTSRSPSCSLLTQSAC